MKKHFLYTVIIFVLANLWVFYPYAKKDLNIKDKCALEFEHTSSTDIFILSALFEESDIDILQETNKTSISFVLPEVSVLPMDFFVPENIICRTAWQEETFHKHKYIDSVVRLCTIS